MSEIVTNNPFLNDVVEVYKKLLDVTAENKFVIDTKDNIKEYLENLSIGNEKTGELLVSFTSSLASTTIAKTMDQSLVIVERSTKSVLENNLLQKQIDSEDKSIALKTQQIASMIKEDTIKEAQNVKELDIKTKQALDIAKSTDLKTQQIASMIKEDTIKEAQNVKELDIKTKQALDIAKSTEVKTAQITSITKDNLIKDKQVTKLDEEIDLLESQDLELKESILDRQQKRPVEVANLTKQGTLIDGQVAKLSEDKLFVIAQKTSMLEQVQDNKKIKAMDSMADMIGTLGAGGLVPGTAILQTYFELNKGLTGVNLPTSYTITKAV